MEWTIAKEGLDDFAQQFWAAAKGARLFAFHGPMGAGKTTIITALCRSRGVTDAVSSPTFSIINEYAYTQNGSVHKLYHIDLYRLRDEEEIIQSGVEDCVYSPSLCLVEWPEKAPWLFGPETAHVHIEALTETERRIRLDGAFSANG